MARAAARVLDASVALIERSGAVLAVAGASPDQEEKLLAGGERFFRFEHPVIMIIALVVAHIAAARARRAAGPLAAARVRTIGAALSLLLIVIGIPWNRA